MSFLLCPAKPAEHLFICVMVCTPADSPLAYGKLTDLTGGSWSSHRGLLTTWAGRSLLAVFRARDTLQ